MSIKAFVATRLREGDTFTERNAPDLAGKTVWDLEVLYRNVYLTMTDRTCAVVDRRAVVEIER
jgi:hypothetical protein